MYDAYKEAAAKEKWTEEHAVYSYFRRVILKKYKKTLKFPRKTRLGRCDICCQLASLASMLTTKEQRAQLKEMKKEHYLMQMAERKEYVLRRQLARDNPNTYLSTICDKSKAIYLPRFAKPGKDDARYGYPMEIYAVREHNKDDRFFYLMPKLWPGDPNVTITILLDYLRRRKEALGELPRTWLLQLDNSGHENKNQFVMGLCAMLVSLNWFDNIVVSFLIPGHTHEDVDQDFSVFWRYAANKNILTVPDLRTALITAFSKQKDSNVTCVLVRKMFDFKQVIPSTTAKINGVQAPFSFLFSRQHLHCVQVRDYCSKGSWSKPIELISGPPTLQAKSIPPCGKKVKKMEKKVKKIVSKFGQRLFFHTGAFTWWRKLLKSKAMPPTWDYEEVAVPTNILTREEHRGKPSPISLPSLLRKQHKHALEEKIKNLVGDDYEQWKRRWEEEKRVEREKKKNSNQRRQNGVRGDSDSDDDSDSGTNTDSDNSDNESSWSENGDSNDGNDDNFNSDDEDDYYTSACTHGPFEDGEDGEPVSDEEEEEEEGIRLSLWRELLNLERKATLTPFLPRRLRPPSSRTTNVRIGPMKSAATKVIIIFFFGSIVKKLKIF